MKNKLCEKKGSMINAAIQLLAKGTPFSLFFLGMLLLLLSFPAMGQSRLSVKFRPGISFATTEVYGANINTGFGFEGSLSYRVFPQISAYAGWGWNTFTSSESFAGTDVHFEETGYVVGVQFFHAVGNESAFDYFFRGGLIIDHIEIESAEGEIIADSGHGPGFQVEAGLCFPVGEQWHLIPGIKYQTLSREIDFERVAYPVDLNYLSAGVSVSWTF